MLVFSLSKLNSRCPGLLLLVVLLIMTQNRVVTSNKNSHNCPRTPCNTLIFSAKKIRSKQRKVYP
jgi:hypothetical protein